MFKDKLPSYYRSKLLQKLYKTGRKFKCNYIPSKKGHARKRCAVVNDITAFKNVCNFTGFKVRTTVLLYSKQLGGYSTTTMCSFKNIHL